MNEFNLVKMTDVADVTSAKRIFARDYVDAGIPFYRGKEITELHRGALEVSTNLYITEKKFSEIKEKHGVPEHGDILLTSVGTLGSVYLLKPGDRFYFKDGNVTWFRNLKHVTGAYLRYWLISPEGRAQLQKCMIGSSQSAYTIENLKRMEIRLPPLETQRRIASILGAYDDLIGGNRRRIAVLEEMARGLFEEWFVRFRFPGHEAVPILDTPDGPLPEGWTWEPFSALADFINGFAFKPSHFEDEGLPIVKIPELKNGVSTKTPRNSGRGVPQRLHIKDGYLLFSWSGTFAISEWTCGDALLNQHLFLVTPKREWGRGFIKEALIGALPKFDNQGVGATMKHIRRSALDQTMVAIPSSLPIINQANGFFDAQYAQLVALRQSNQRLATSRDLLLPRLISGQLSVAEATRQLEEAA